MDEYKSKLQSEELDALFRAILALRTTEECYRFFDDLCTVPEMLSISQRWKVAELLDAGETYQDISGKLNASTATISRVNRCLTYGACGYRQLLDRLKENSADGN